MLASWNALDAPAIPGRTERPGFYWSYLVIALGGTLVAAVALLTGTGF
jgi:hypothetical protein